MFLYMMSWHLLHTAPSQYDCLGDVGGFHNWWHYQYLEKLGEINYLGHWERASFGEEMALGGGISFTFTWNGGSKPYGSMWLGTSPELEMALYSVCFMSR